MGTPCLLFQVNKYHLLCFLLYRFLKAQKFTVAPQTDIPLFLLLKITTKNVGVISNSSVRAKKGCPLIFLNGTQWARDKIKTDKMWDRLENEGFCKAMLCFCLVMLWIRKRKEITTVCLLKTSWNRSFT